VTSSVPSDPRGARARHFLAALAAVSLLMPAGVRAQTGSIGGNNDTNRSSTSSSPPGPASASEPGRGSATTMAATAAGAKTEPAADTRPVSSRAEQIAKAQAERALTAKPYQQSGFEKAIDIAEDFIVDPPKVYPWFGSIYPGGLFALGAGVRLPYGDTGSFDMHAGWSFRNYTGVEANLHLPELAGPRVAVDLHGQFINAPRVQFHGLGQESAEAIAHYRYRPATVGTTLTVRPVPLLAIGGGVDYVDVTTGGAKTGVSVEHLFSPVTAPGLDADPTYLRTRAFAGVDWRESPGYTRRGGWYHAEWSDYRQRNDGPYSFQRLDAEVQQFVPLLRNNWVLAFRGLVSTTETDAGEEVPYFLMPDLGGGSDLRGYSSFRFRDRHRLLLTGEYRWAAGQFVDMALFVDAGKVVSRRSDLNLRELVPTYGIGVRFHAPQATVLRIDVAKTREGIGVIFTAGQIF